MVAPISSSRLYITLRRIYESQPLANRDTLELVARFMDESGATVNAIAATVAVEKYLRVHFD